MWKIGCFYGMVLASQTGLAFYPKVIHLHSYFPEYTVPLHACVYCDCVHVQMCCEFPINNCKLQLLPWQTIRLANCPPWSTCNRVHVWKRGLLCWYVLQKCKLLLCNSCCSDWCAAFMWGMVMHLCCFYVRYSYALILQDCLKLEYDLTIKCVKKCVTYD